MKSYFFFYAKTFLINVQIDEYKIMSYTRYTLCSVYLGKETAVVVLYLPITDQTLEYSRFTRLTSHFAQDWRLN